SAAFIMPPVGLLSARMTGRTTPFYARPDSAGTSLATPPRVRTRGVCFHTQLRSVSGIRHSPQVRPRHQLVSRLPWLTYIVASVGLAFWSPALARAADEM